MLSHLKFKLCILFLGIFFINNVLANPIIPIPTQPQMIITPTPPDLDAKGYILMDSDSGKILVEKNADMKMAPASLTKLMSMYIISMALKNGTIHLDDKVRISKKAWQTGGSRMFVKVDEEVPVRDLIQGIVVVSGNDATVAMAEYVAGSEESFANLMNVTAKALGMNNSHFTDSNGLPNPNHYSTPRDLAILARAIVKDFPEDYKLYSEKWFAYRNIKQPNRNRLLWRFNYADGLKTGHTDDAGYCLVASALKNNTRLISVVMGAPNDRGRTDDSIRLLTYGFRFFETHKFYNANVPLIDARTWKGQFKATPLGLSTDFYVTMPAGQFKNLQASLQLNNPMQAPIIKTHTYGKVIVTLDNQVVASQNLIALANNPKGGFFSNVTDAFRYRFQQLFSKTVEKANNA